MYMVSEGEGIVSKFENGLFLVFLLTVSVTGKESGVGETKESLYGVITDMGRSNIKSSLKVSSGGKITS